MAYWNRKAGRVYVYYWKDGKQTALPRAEVKHLDAEPKHNIQTWVEHWSLTNEKPKGSTAHPLLGTSPLARYLESYHKYLLSRGKSRNTAVWHDSLLRQWVIPFFLEKNLPDLHTWPSESIRLLEYMEAKKVSFDNMLRTNIALRAMWKYLTEEGIIPSNAILKLRNPIRPKRRRTPLEYKLSPKEVLQWCKKQSSQELKMLALFGYFFSLRPQETFVLKRAQFRAGEKCLELECSKNMRAVKQYGRLVVNIDAQLSEGKEVDPKKGSSGWVACFDEKAARMIVECLMQKQKDEPLFTVHPDTLFERWADGGIENVTLKDLRRASLLHLGSLKGMQPHWLMKHARHKRMETTLLYMRTPEEKLQDMDELDLDA